MKRTSPIAVALAVVAALPATAGAATVTVDAQCYRANTTINFTLAGFTPSDFVTLAYNGGLLDAPGTEAARERAVRAHLHRAYTKSEVSHPLRKTVKLGKPQGPCGTLTYRGKLLPISKPKSGVWEIQVDGRFGFKRQFAPYAATTTFVAPKRKR